LFSAGKQHAKNLVNVTIVKSENALVAVYLFAHNTSEKFYPIGALKHDLF
jgi:hypothetical protein